MQAKPQGQAQAPVSAADLAEHLKLFDDDDPTLQGYVDVASDIVREYLGKELIEREYVLTYFRWPTMGTVNNQWLSRPMGGPQEFFVLPYANLLEIESVKSGEEFLDYTEQGDGVFIPYNDSGESPALEITYTAGYGDEYDVPEAVKFGILMLAGYLYNLSGSCDSYDALNKSGASLVLRSHRQGYLLA
jgi:hypothetical protein